MKGNSILVSPAILPDPRMRLAARQIHPFFNRDPTSSNLFQSNRNCKMNEPSNGIKISSLEINRGYGRTIRYIKFGQIYMNLLTDTLTNFSRVNYFLQHDFYNFMSTRHAR